MRKLKVMLLSRTVWTVVVLFLINGFTGIKSYIPAQWLPLVNGLLGILAIYFRVNPQAESRI